MYEIHNYSFYFYIEIFKMIILKKISGQIEIFKIEWEIFLNISEVMENSQKYEENFTSWHKNMLFLFYPVKLLYIFIILIWKINGEMAHISTDVIHNWNCYKYNVHTTFFKFICFNMFNHSMFNHSTLIYVQLKNI